jgi:transposase-like protein
MSKRQKRNFSAEEKASIIKRHLKGKEAVSDICDEQDIAPNQFYRWQQDFFENPSAAVAI